MTGHILIWTAIGVGFIHTLFGPDHYLPFVFLARARNWSLTRLWWIVSLCGIGHVLSSILLGILGLGAGVAVAGLVNIESVRGEIAAYLLMIFGVLYLFWGIRRGIKNKPHAHLHHHEDHVHTHVHTHEGEHVHVHEGKTSVTPWVLFIIFVFGPCEPLIPIFIYPAAQHHWGLVLAVSIGFSAATIGTMLLTTTLLTMGANLVPLKSMERWTHAIAGGVIAASGAAITFLGL